MPNANRNAGDYFERSTKAALDAVGFWVIRAAGSFGVADVVAMRARSAPLLIACKTNGVLPRAEREALVEAAQKAGARPVLATRSRRGWVDLYTVDKYGAKPLSSLKVPSRSSDGSPAEQENDDDESK